MTRDAFDRHLLIHESRTGTHRSVWRPSLLRNQPLARRVMGRPVRTVFHDTVARFGGADRRLPEDVVLERRRARRSTSDVPVADPGCLACIFTRENHSESAEAASTPHIVKRAELPGLERLRRRVGGPSSRGAPFRASRVAARFSCENLTQAALASHPARPGTLSCESGRTGVNELFRVKGRRWRCHFDTIRGRTHALCSPRHASQHA
jgi:hypothetical protein